MERLFGLWIFIAQPDLVQVIRLPPRRLYVISNCLHIGISGKETSLLFAPASQVSSGITSLLFAC